MRRSPGDYGVCLVDVCDSRATHKEMCSKHYQINSKHGTPYWEAPTYEESFWGNVDLTNPTGCWLWKASTFRRGYGQFRHKPASRVAYTLVYGEPPAGMLVCHKCDNPPCCNPDHLFLGSAKDNASDRNSKGRNADVTGERNPMSKLNPEDVISIREMSAEGVARKAIAKSFGIHPEYVALVVNKRRWAHIV